MFLDGVRQYKCGRNFYGSDYVHRCTSPRLSYYLVIVGLSLFMRIAGSSDAHCPRSFFSLMGSYRLDHVHSPQMTDQTYLVLSSKASDRDAQFRILKPKVL